MPQNIFVYGTLRCGQRNHHLLRNTAYLGLHRSDPVFIMLHLGAFPGVVRGGSTAIVGEVYRVNPATLRTLDVLEDYPVLYTRERIATPYGPAWVYLYQGGERGHRITNGDWCKV